MENANGGRRRIEFRKTFLKQYDKLPEKIRRQTMLRIALFAHEDSGKQLHDHALSGKYHGYRSINITGDIRALYYEKDDGRIVIFAFLGTHSQLYG